jgi:coenzyme F420-reducing hydrogenase gamma subunit
MANKKQVGIFTYTCDEGCSIYLIEIFNDKLLGWLEKMELRYFLSVRDKRDFEHLDIALVEGVISTEKELAEIKELRSKTDILIAMGTCAITALPSGQRNNFNAKQKEAISEHVEKYHYLPKTLSVKEAVKVDDEIMGCPIDEKKFIEIFEKYLNDN